MPEPASGFPFRSQVRVSCAAALSLALGALSASAPAVAAKVYRCGNAFQDQPCPDVRSTAMLAADRPLAVARPTPCAMRAADARTGCAAKATAPREQPPDIKR